MKSQKCSIEAFKTNKMFTTSSQKRIFTFAKDQDLTNCRVKHNQAHLLNHGGTIDEDLKVQFFLTPDEEKILLKNYELHLIEFCKRFEPPMPRAVVGTAFHYFKRFYLHKSPMDYHPKEIL